MLRDAAAVGRRDTADQRRTTFTRKMKKFPH
jgi:hypothetical protein